MSLCQCVLRNSQHSEIRGVQGCVKQNYREFSKFEFSLVVTFCNALPLSLALSTALFYTKLSSSIGISCNISPANIVKVTFPDISCTFSFQLQKGCFFSLPIPPPPLLPPPLPPSQPPASGNVSHYLVEFSEKDGFSWVSELLDEERQTLEIQYSRLQLGSTSFTFNLQMIQLSLSKFQYL